MIDQRQVFSVQELNHLAKEVLEQLSFWVSGEIYDFKNAERRYYYVYFSLKEGEYVLPCIMLPQVFDQLAVPLENGQKVLAHGKLTLFPKSGKFQFSIDTIEVAGEGALAKELEALKAKLQSEGLLDQARKRPLPTYPQKIGVIASADSDAWADFQRHSAVKFPIMELFLADSFVQGRRAVSSLLTAIELMQHQPVEVLVLIRGGGSLDDLAAFNDEKVVRAIAASKIPTIVGVGHEKDISVADLVADVRASTPTNAGQILTQAYEEVTITLANDAVRLRRLGQQLVQGAAADLDQLVNHLQRTTDRYKTLPLILAQTTLQLSHAGQNLLTNLSFKLTNHRQQLDQRGRYIIERTSQHLEAAQRQLQAVSPEAVLARGYSLVMVDGKVIRSSHQVAQGDTMQVRLARGGLRGLITRVED